MKYSAQSREAPASPPRSAGRAPALAVFAPSARLGVAAAHAPLRAGALAGDVLELQRTAGNQVVGRLLQDRRQRPPGETGTGLDRDATRVRPSGRGIWAAYDAVKYNPDPSLPGRWSGKSPSEVWDMIGGSIGRDLQGLRLSCAARLSYAFNYGGIPIERDAGLYNDPDVAHKGKPGDGKNYVVNAQNLRNYLTEKWGEPDAILRTHEQARTFAERLGDDEIAVFVGEHHAGAIRKYTRDGYKDPYLFKAFSAIPTSAWKLP